MTVVSVTVKDSHVVASKRGINLNTIMKIMMILGKMTITTTTTTTTTENRS